MSSDQRIVESIPGRQRLTDVGDRAFPVALLVYHSNSCQTAPRIHHIYYIQLFQIVQKFASGFDVNVVFSKQKSRGKQR